MRKYNELYLIRHGQTEWNREHRHQGGRDSPLTALGRSQARKVGGWIGAHVKGRPDLTAFTSPQGRARATAEIVLTGTGLTARPDDRLREVAFGDWEGMLHEEVRAVEGVEEMIEREGFLWHFHSPGGETFEDLRQRATSFLGDLPGPAIVIAHGVLLRVMRAVWLGLCEYDLDAMTGGQGVIFHLAPGQGERVIEPGAQRAARPET